MKQVRRPTVIIDKAQCQDNIYRAVSKARAENVILRPHFKTHQSHTIGRWFRDAGIERITVSSLTMAEYFAADGWDDITLAMPLNPNEIEELNKLAARISLQVFVTERETLELVASRLTSPLAILIEIDTGQHRSGLQADDVESIEKILALIDGHPYMSFRGFATHAGHSYSAGSVERVREIHRESLAQMLCLREQFTGRYPELILSAGDTPTFSLAEGFASLDELRPGNFVFFDLSQEAIGSCTLGQISLCVYVPVISVKKKEKELVIYGGAVHLSKDVITLATGKQIFGLAVRVKNGKWDASGSAMYVRSLSQEHGLIDLGKNDPSEFKPGDIIGIIPVHSCLTADVAGRYYTVDGLVLEKMPRLLT